MSEHTHEWLRVGLRNDDGSASFPCRHCDAELRRQDGQETVIPGGFTNPLGLVFVDPDGLERLILRECLEDYDDGLALNRNSKVVDIGAHVGVVSMYLAKKYGCTVAAFEPNRRNFRRLQDNIIANRLSFKVYAYPFAVTGDGREVRISTSKDNSGSGNIYSGKGRRCHSVTLAELVRNGGDIDLLKIDCEGAEYEMLADTEALRCVKAIRGEFHPGPGRDMRALLAAVREIVPDTKVTLLGESEP